ncbi:NAD(P)-binding domain-containing protein [Hoyosella subflava]|uniref:Putative oxidoreductase n=1 Tax=Hoyosella subflava (strain DSM 45089 / JCM 17490 / NBRC 109087 / DQS3-9A1) TaxID=443218 RepID=F6ELS6_HOYSD|nr:NAD(P)-binding domain-containing protein [Hoyosella subflava]AEF41524.1 Putative oxidoreductase [Hoyosella subflava DQS3-9A1]
MKTDPDVAVIGAGQAGLSGAYYLHKAGLAPGTDFVVLDGGPNPGGAWQFRWPSLTLMTVNGISDLPGMRFSETLDEGTAEVRASEAVPRYYAEYERRFGLAVERPVRVRVVCDRTDDGRLNVETSAGTLSVRGLINATGTWERPFIPFYPGADTFTGWQLHTRDYQTAAEFAGKHTIVVGGGISAVQLIDEVSRVTTTTWVTRSEPVFRDEPFTAEIGRRAVALVEDRVRRGLPPGSVVSVTGIPVTPEVRDAQRRGVLDRRPMFERIESDGVRYADGTFERADIIFWCTGFRSSLDHLAPLSLRGPGGGITMTGQLATRVAQDPRIHLIGYGPSASTIGANRAGRAAVRELLEAIRR